MYNVTIHNGAITQLIHDHRAASNAQKLPTASFTEAVNSISSCTFTIYPGNAGYDSLEEYTTQLKVYNTKRSRNDFVGRVLKIKPQMDTNGKISKQVVCEDRLGYLQDSLQPYAETKHYEGDDSRTGLEEFIDVLLNNHNAQVEEYKRIYRGIVTVDPFETSDNVTKGLNWETTYKCIMDKLVGSFGGYIVLRETGGVLYLDYLKTVGTTRNTKITVGRNMKSASKDIDPSGIVTRVVPLGAKIKTVGEDGQERETEERLTIADVNDGVTYIEATEYLNRYGIKYATVVFDDVTDPSNLKSKGQDWIIANNGLALKHAIKALDLSQIGLDIDDFVLYDSYPVENSAIGIDDILQIIKKTTNIVKPHDSSFEMGDITKRLSDSLINQNTSLDGIREDISSVNSEIKNQVTTIYTYVNTSVSSIQQTSDQIWAMVEDKVTATASSTLESFAETVRNILQMEADGTTMIFQTLYEELSRVEGIEASHYAELLTYIRFSEDGIEIGKEGNAITMKLDNDSLEFYNNGVRVAYMSDEVLYITDGRFTRSVRIGNYGFIPETDNSVSFAYLGGE